MEEATRTSCVFLAKRHFARDQEVTLRYNSHPNRAPFVYYGSVNLNLGSLTKCKGSMDSSTRRWGKQNRTESCDHYYNCYVARPPPAPAPPSTAKAKLSWHLELGFGLLSRPSISLCSMIQYNFAVMTFQLKIPHSSGIGGLQSTRTW